jgi:signal peptide peptidase SppA
MKYAHIINYFNSQPWAILPEKLHAMISLIELRSAGFTLTDNEIEARIGQDGLDAAAQQQAAPSSIAVLPIMGTISHRMGLLRRASAGMTIEGFREDFRAALDNRDISAIVLDIDSPGGSTSGIEEMADEIYEGRKAKRIIASVNSLSASAAYWLASAANEIAVTPSGHVGSIGVLGVHMDFSEQAKETGVAVTVVSAGKYKAEASEFTPLTDGARQHLQAIVDDRYDAFIRAVARGRGTSQRSVREGYGEGRLVTAKDALSMAMIDSIETTDQVLARVSGRARRARKIAEVASWNLENLVGEDGLETAVIGATAETMAAQDRDGFKPQTLIAPKTKWDSLDVARSWAKEHGYRVDKVDDTPQAWCFRQRDPGDFKQLRTICINPGPDTAPTMDASKMLMVGGLLKEGVVAAFHDPEAEGVDEFLPDAIVPADISTEIAPDGTTWNAPALKNFTPKSWAELSDAEKRNIAKHAAWAKAMPPENFGDIKLFHHRPSDGAIVPNGVRNALARLSQTQDLGEDRPRVEAHLRRHMDAIQKRRESARANPNLDADRAALELMELG